MSMLPSRRSLRAALRLKACFSGLALAACAEGSTSSDFDNIVADSSVAPYDAGKALDSAIPYPSFDGGGLVDAGAVANDGGRDAATDASTSDAGDGGGSDSGTAIGLAGTGLTPLTITGMPLTATDKKWTYFEIDGAFCRDGSKAGFTLYRNTASKKLMFFFEGGGACFDGLTCGANPASVDATDKAGPTGGVLDLTNAKNPFKDWNVAYIPYCTGDVFAGTRDSVMVDGVGTQKFVGYKNTTAFLQRLAPTFTDLTDLMVTGVSAGGFGASASVIQVQRAFPNVKGKLIDDSGPPMPSPVLATCLQKKWRETWGLEGSMLADCGADCTKPDDYTYDYGIKLAKMFAGRYSGLIESVEDGVISGFFGAGTDFLGGGPCTGAALLTPVPAQDFHNGLLKYREAIKQYPTFGTYFPPGTQHTWLMGPSFYEGAIGSTTLLQWVTDIVTEKGTSHVGQ